MGKVIDEVLNHYQAIQGCLDGTVEGVDFQVSNVFTDEQFHNHWEECQSDWNVMIKANDRFIGYYTKKIRQSGIATHEVIFTYDLVAEGDIAFSLSTFDEAVELIKKAAKKFRFLKGIPA